MLIVFYDLRPMQTDATFFEPNMLHLFARNHNDVGTCWHLLTLVAYSLKPVNLLAQQVPTFLFFCDRRSVARVHMEP